jgi:hypothetical protein
VSGIVEQWEADMAAWSLTSEQRRHHLWRLYRYHRSLEAVYWRRYERSTRAEEAFALIALFWLIFLAVLLSVAP